MGSSKNIFLNNYGVSEVIGIILLVALTVAVSAVTAVFFFGYMQNVNKPYLIEISASRLDPNSIQIMNRGGQDINMLDKSGGNPFIVTIGGVESHPITGSFDIDVGSAGKFNCPPGARILITGTFKDNTKHILYDSSL